jgi:hypothetical protein
VSPWPRWRRPDQSASQNHPIPTTPTGHGESPPGRTTPPRAVTLPPGPVGVAASALTPDEAAQVALTVLAGQRSDNLDLPAGWFIADLTDGRLTGHHHDGGWTTGHHAFPDDTPTPLAADGSDLWRLLTLHVFDENRQVTIRGDQATLHGWHLTEVPIPADTHPALDPRDRSFLIGDQAGSATSNEGYTRITERNGRLTVIPGPYTAPSTSSTAAGAASTGTWLLIREYWAADPHTGAVAVHSYRYLAFTTGAQPTRSRT